MLKGVAGIPVEWIVWAHICKKKDHKEFCSLRTGIWYECTCRADEQQGVLYSRYLNKIRKLKLAKNERSE